MYALATDCLVEPHMAEGSTGPKLVPAVWGCGETLGLKADSDDLRTEPAVAAECALATGGHATFQPRNPSKVDLPSQALRPYARVLRSLKLHSSLSAHAAPSGATGRQRRADERLLLKAANWRCRPKPARRVALKQPDGKTSLFLFCFYEAAVRDLTQPAVSRRW